MVTKETPETFYIGNTVATKLLIMSLKRCDVVDIFVLKIYLFSYSSQVS